MALKGKVALITGASRGIGKAILGALGDNQATVVGTATSERGVKDINDYIEKSQYEGMGIILDVTSQASIDKALEVIQIQYNSPTILVNNAGITQDNLLIRMSEDEWDKVLSTNLGGVYRLAKSCLRGMLKAKWGRVINIGSVVGAMGNVGQVNYSATKAGLEGFTRSLAKEVGSRSITVNVIAPGFIETDMTHALSDEKREEIFQQIPLQRLGKPEEIAQVACFLAGDTGGYITGESIHVNGGIYMH